MTTEDFPLIREISRFKPSARKDYPCAFCNQPIKKGERHIKVAFVDENDNVRSARYHAVCPQ